MKTLSTTILSLVITVSQAMASSGSADGEGLSLLATFFISFFVLIILFQFVPGIMLFVGMLKGIFSSSTAHENKKVATNTNKPS
ncbi:MAG: hypothetical protein ABSA86_06110 [Oryzomonas sp.]|jgi:hypothetical protein